MLWRILRGWDEWFITDPEGARLNAGEWSDAVQKEVNESEPQVLEKL